MPYKGLVLERLAVGTGKKGLISSRLFQLLV